MRARHDKRDTRPSNRTFLLQPRKEMPILTPSYLPHPPGLSSHSPSSKATCLRAPGSQVPTPPTSPEQDAVTQRSDPPPKRECALKIPSVSLEVHSIQDNMAASLAIALLGHVLFLKSQVPLCVAPSFLLFLFFFVAWPAEHLAIFIQPRCAAGTRSWWNVRIACGQEALGHDHSVR